MHTTTESRPGESTNATARVVGIGEALMRLNVGRGQSLAHAPVFEAFVGGAEVNVLVALGSLGVPTRFVGALPTDQNGLRVRSALRGAGVDCSFVTEVEGGRLGLYFTEEASLPRGHRVFYDRSASVVQCLPMPGAAAYSGAEFALVTGITPALGDHARRATALFVAEARAAGARLCVDVNHRALLWPAEQARGPLAALAAEADVLVCAERDARAVFGLAGEHHDVALALARQVAPRAELVVLTRSSQGADLVVDGAVQSLPAVPAEVVDRFGAGDAFTAGLLSGLLDGCDPATAARAGLALAAMACTVRGDLTRFSRPELDAVLADGAGRMIR